jgi:hypothetical protein
LVTAEGILVRADRDTNADLFWAVRGGGGSFGIVTEIEIELYPTPELYAGALFFPVERAGAVLRAWREWAETVPDEVTSLGRILHLPPIPDIPEPLRGKSFAVIEAVAVAPEEEGAELIGPLRALEPLMDTFAAVAPAALTHLHMDPPQPVPGVGDGMLLDELPVDAIDAIVATAVPPLLSLEIRHLGGALARPAAGHGAVGSFEAHYAMFAVGIAPTAEIGAAIGRAIDGARSSLAPWASPRSYLNFSERSADTEQLYPPQTYRRLRAIKALHDPSELIVASHSIPPLR